MRRHAVWTEVLIQLRLCERSEENLTGVEQTRRHFDLFGPRDQRDLAAPTEEVAELGDHLALGCVMHLRSDVLGALYQHLGHARVLSDVVEQRER